MTRTADTAPNLWDADTASVDAWSDATGSDLAARTVARLESLSTDSRDVEIDSYSFGGWAKGDRAVYTQGHTAATHRVKFSHNRYHADLLINIQIDTGIDFIEATVLVHAERLGMNGQIRNTAANVGYRAGADLQHFVPCGPNARSVAIYRALGMDTEASAAQADMDEQARLTR
jgi:hypothetical protein